jgi:hypothetical protein
MSRTLRLLAELVEGPPVRTTGGTLELLAGEALEERVADAIPRRVVAITSVRTLQRGVGRVRRRRHVGPRRRAYA